MKLTLNRINKELALRNLPVQLVRGDGYFYFIGDVLGNKETTSVMVYRLNHLTMEQWMEEATALMSSK